MKLVGAFMLLAFGLAAALPARAVQLEPGLWQDTETGKDDGAATKPEVHTSCLSPEEARDPVKTILKDSEGQKCDKYEVREDGDTVTVEIKCGDPKDTRMELDMTIKFMTTKHYSGTMKSRVVFKGVESRSEGTIDSVWLASSCTK
jgi:hypothetical protein